MEDLTRPKYDIARPEDDLRPEFRCGLCGMEYKHRDMADSCCDLVARIAIAKRNPIVLIHEGVSQWTSALIADSLLKDPSMIS